MLQRPASTPLAHCSYTSHRLAPTATVCRGVASRQSGKGLWHQLLDRPDSYLETSCTAMFSYSMAKGVNRGWLDASTMRPTTVMPRDSEIPISPAPSTASRCRTHGA